MSSLEKDELEKRIAALPPLAQVAYACRCARRLQPHYDGSRVHRLAKAIDFAEVVAAKGRTLSVVAQSAWDSYETLEADWSEGLAGLAAQAASRAAKAANFALGVISTDDSSWPPQDYYKFMLVDAATNAALWAGEAKQDGLDTWPAQVADLQRLERRQLREHWDDQVMIDQGIFGPLWPPAAMSVFISYGGPDEAFATRLYDSLRAHGVRVFFFPASAVAGMKVHDLMREGVENHDRVVLVCSRDSLKRPGVMNEIEKTLEREAEEGGVSRLIPVDIDGYVFSQHYEKIGGGHCKEIRRRVVADFTRSLQDEERFAVALARLLRALEVEAA